MALRDLTRIPKLPLVYFSSDKTTCILETKKLRQKETQGQFVHCGPEKLSTVLIKHAGKELDAMVIASDGKSGCLNCEYK